MKWASTNIASYPHNTPTHLSVGPPAEEEVQGVLQAGRGPRVPHLI